jgi:hypothetical protein
MTKANALHPVTWFQLICPVCGVLHERDEKVPTFETRREASDYAIGTLDWHDGETMARAVARACRIIGCGETAYDLKLGHAKTAFSLVLKFFKGDRRKASLWFSTANPLLGGISPAKMIQVGRYDKLLRWVKTQLAENERQEGA